MNDVICHSVYNIEVYVMLGLESLANPTEADFLIFL